jgi:hypothetical protein
MGVKIHFNNKTLIPPPPPPRVSENATFGIAVETVFRAAGTNEAGVDENG